MSTTRFIKLDTHSQPLPADATHWPMVHDTETGLIWLTDYAAPQCLTWADAKAAAEAVTAGGFSDWRLPTRKELLSLVDDTRCDPAIDTTFFPGTKPNWHWSSSLLAGDPGYAWCVGFGYGLASCSHRDNDGGFVRAVRSVAAVSPGQ